MVRSSLVVAALVSGAAGSAGAQTPQLLAPYQIESVETRFEIYGDDLPMVVVAFTRAPDSANPEAGLSASELEPPEIVTIVGEAGWIHAGLTGVEKRCEFPCSLEGGDECHWTGLYSPLGPLADIGTPVAALPGRLELTEFVALEPIPGLEPLPGLVDSVPHLQASDEASPLIWERTPDWQPTYRVDTWTADGGILDLTIIQPTGDSTRVQAGGCESTPREWLLTIDCNGLSLIASRGKPLLVSWPDYNLAKADVIARFEYAGSRHYVVRLGSKAQDLIGLLSGEPTGWRARFRQRDWASLC
jgi:hypothetical protein